MSSAQGTRRIISLILVVIMMVSMAALGGCAGSTGSREIELTPTIGSPAIGTDGVLKVGVDSSNVPYAGLSDGNIVGIDVDIAAAVAEQLGLRLELVDLSGQNADSLLNEGTVDMVMGIEQTGGSIIQGLKIGPYIHSGPALFTVVKSDELPTIDLKSLAGTKIAAQKESLSAWSLEELVGKGTSDPRETLTDAFKALESGEVSYAAADAVVGSYLALEYDSIACVKMLGTPIGVYMGVSAENTQLSEALTEALRTVRNNGTLQVILAKWFGPVSSQVVLADSAITSGQTDSAVSPENTTGELDTGDDLPDPSNANSA